jgi:tetratricopeptide (TPR) repeat protein
MSQTAVDMARRLGDQATLVYALEGRYDSYWGPDALEERLAITDELLQLAEETGDKERAYEARDHRFYVLLEAGDLPAALDVQEAKARLAGELRQPAQQWDVRISTANLDLFMGRFEDAESNIEGALELGRLPASANAVAGYELQLYGLRREEGRLDEIVDNIASAFERFPSYPVWRYVVADVFAELDRREAARDALDALAADGFAMQLEMQWLFSLTLLPEVCRYLGDVERSAMVYELLLPYACLNAVTPPELCRGSVSRGLGILAATMGRWDDAVCEFEQALEMNARMNALPWLAHAQHDYAQMLLDRGHLGDRGRATELLDQALATYRQLSMDGFARRAAALAQTAGRSRPTRGDQSRFE